MSILTPGFPLGYFLSGRRTMRYSGDNDLYLHHRETTHKFAGKWAQKTSGTNTPYVQALEVA